MIVRAALAAMLLSAPAVAAPVSGHWAGDGLDLDATAQGAKLALDCAAGSIDTPITPDKDGTFAATGRFNAWQPGPQRADEPPADTAVHFTGKLHGDHMTLTVLRPGMAPQTFALKHGAATKLKRCL